MASATVKNGIGHLTVTNGKYYGGIKDGKQHGKGKYSFANGNVYEGDWKDGKKHGKGKNSWADGSVYDGDVYEGDWKDGHFHGTGKYSFASGDVYEGDYKEGKKHGTGKHSWGDGTVCEGDVYEGDWTDGYMNGTGKRSYANGNVYEGYWKDDKKHGTGKFSYANGAVDEGDWKDGEKQENVEPRKQPEAGAPPATHEPLTAAALASAPPDVQKNMIGERLYPLIHNSQPDLAGKITGMLLEMDNSELLHFLESPGALKHKITEALQVLEAHKNMIGERLYPLIHNSQPDLAGKITGMLLEMDNSELLHLLESPDALNHKITEALQVLEAHNQNSTTD